MQPCQATLPNPSPPQTDSRPAGDGGPDGRSWRLSALETPPPHHLIPEEEAAPIVGWATLGIDPAWVEQHLRPACDALGEHLQPLDSPGGLDDLRQECYADALIFIGTGAAGQMELEDAVQRATSLQPLALLLAVVPSASLGRQLSLMRAGAFDTLSMTARDPRIGETLGRAVELITQRRRIINREKLRLISQLAISVNHEINNPLTGLMGTAELLLLENKGLGEKAQRDLRLILQQCRRIQEVTARLKTLNHMRTVPYGAHDSMIDLVGEIAPGPPPAPAEEPHAPPTDSGQFLPAPKLLVIDDNPLIIDLMMRLFEQTFHIEGATTVSEALRMLEHQSYDLLLIDLIMPEMNGLELFREIRRLRPDQKAFLTTAYEGDARVEQAIVEGAMGCIYKPFQIEEVERILSEALHPDGETDEGV